MKKLFVLTASVCLLAGCALFQKQTNPAEVCQINKKDCWKVAQLLGQTKEVPADPNTASQEAWWNMPNGVKYENEALTKMGLTVTRYMMYRDGGSTLYVLNDEVSFATNRRLGENPEYGVTTVKFKDGRTFKYDADGKLIK